MLDRLARPGLGHAHRLLELRGRLVQGDDVVEHPLQPHGPHHRVAARLGLQHSRQVASGRRRDTEPGGAQTLGRRRVSASFHPEAIQHDRQALQQPLLLALDQIEGQARVGQGFVEQEGGTAERVVRRGRRQALEQPQQRSIQQGAGQ